MDIRQPFALQRNLTNSWPNWVVSQLSLSFRRLVRGLCIWLQEIFFIGIFLYRLQCFSCFSIPVPSPQLCTTHLTQICRTSRMRIISKFFFIDDDMTRVLNQLSSSVRRHEKLHTSSTMHSQLSLALVILFFNIIEDLIIFNQSI